MIDPGKMFLMTPKQDVFTDKLPCFNASNFRVSARACERGFHFVPEGGRTNNQIVKACQGHNRKAGHRAYARRALVRMPSREEYKKNRPEDSNPGTHSKPYITS